MPDRGRLDFENTESIGPLPDFEVRCIVHRVEYDGLDA